MPSLGGLYNGSAPMYLYVFHFGVGSQLTRNMTSSSPKLYSASRPCKILKSSSLDIDIAYQHFYRGIIAPEMN